MPASKLASAVTAVDWNKNVANFAGDIPTLERIAQRNLRLATWSRQFELIDIGNPALTFIREMQVCGHLVAVNTSLSVYKSAASSMRSMLETALYYTYFRLHPAELTTLVNNPKYFVSKNDVVEYHNLHTVDFSKLQVKIGFVSRLNPWYSMISAIVHGQIPGQWNQKVEISKMTFDSALQSTVVDAFCDAEELVHKLFLCTVGREMWEYFSSSAKKSLLAGMSGEIRKEFGLDFG